MKKMALNKQMQKSNWYISAKCYQISLCTIESWKK